MNLLRYLENKENELQKSIAKREAFLSSCPNGNLQCFRNSNYYTWYLVTYSDADNGKKKNRTRIKKKDIALATKLAQKGFNEDALRIEKKQLKAIQLFLKYYPQDEPGQKYFERNYEYMRLSKPQYAKHKYSDSEWAWMNKPRPVSQEWQHELIVPTVLEYYVRSKSEADFIAKFVELGIVFRYEWPTWINGYDNHVFPDFRILNTKTGEEYIVEHFGKMDDQNYVFKQGDKLDKYLQNGWLPGKNLFLSYETKATPFTLQDAEEKIREWFPDLVRE